MEFEFDLRKSNANRAKHGIDFVAAQALWLDEDRIEILARTQDEPRWLVVGKIAGRHWTAIITAREERVRIISARKSRPGEVAIYEVQGL